MPTIAEIIANPCTSYWLRDALKSAMQRDPVDALRDARTIRRGVHVREASMDAELLEPVRETGFDL
jgi:hypothetical protein